MVTDHNKTDNQKIEYAYVALELVRECFGPKLSDNKDTTLDIPLKQLYTISESMGITALVAYALNKRGIYDPDFRTALAKAQRRALLLDAEYKKISRQLAAHRIRHLPLKGIVIKELYPSVGLREMSDVDIWFDVTRADDVKSIMTESGYNVKQFGVSKHDVYLKPPMFCFEMHRRIIDTDVLPQSAEYYDEQWKKLNRACKEDEYVPVQSHEDFYVYLIAHAYKHDRIAGTGVRVLLDVYVLLHNWGRELDMPYIEQECRKLGISDFESLVRSLSLRLFNRESPNREAREKLERFILSGIHGNMNLFYSNAITQSESKRSYIRSRIKTSDRQLKEHPFLLKHRILRPLYFPVRLVQAVIKRPKMLSTELKTLIKHK